MALTHKIITITFHTLYNDADHTGNELENAFESGLIEVASEIPCVLIGEVESRGKLQEFPTITGFEDVKKIGPMRGRST
jgi:hypothetical protein